MNTNFIIPQFYTTLYIDNIKEDIDMDNLENVLRGYIGKFRCTFDYQGTYYPLTDANEILSEELIEVVINEMWNVIMCGGCSPGNEPHGTIWLTSI